MRDPRAGFPLSRERLPFGKCRPKGRRYTMLERRFPFTIFHAERYNVFGRVQILGGAVYQTVYV
jgi:hypothetical protein